MREPLGAGILVRDAGTDRWAATEAADRKLTDHVWDTGVIAVADGRAWIAWFTDDD